MTAWPAQAYQCAPNQTYNRLCQHHYCTSRPQVLPAVVASFGVHHRASCAPTRSTWRLPAVDTANRGQQQYAEHHKQQRQQQQQPATTAADATPLLKQRLSECPVCGGTGRVACKDCSGHGFLPRGGYSKKNPLNLSRAVGSKWTAMTDTLGWRHFRVTAVRKLDKHKHTIYLLLQASCDSTAQLWVNALTLRTRSCWAAGWLQMSELLVDAEGVAVSTGHKCHSCAGLGFRACSACDGRGRADLVEV